MRRPLGLIVLLASSTFANFLDTYRGFTDFRPGIVVRGGADLLYIGDDLPHSKSSTSYGYGGGLSLAYPLSENFRLNGEALFLQDVVTYKEDSIPEIANRKRDVKVKSNRIGLQFAPSYRFNSKFGMKLGYQYEIPLGGTSESTVSDTTIKYDLKSAPEEITDNYDEKGNFKQSPVLATHNLIAGATYGVFSWLTVSLEAKLGLHSADADYNSSGFLRGHARKAVVHQVGLSIKTELP